MRIEEVSSRLKEERTSDIEIKEERLKLVRVFLAAEYAMVRAGIRSILAQRSEFIILGEGEDDDEIIEAVSTEAPDVLVLAITDHDSLSFVQTLLRFVSVPVLIVSMDDKLKHAREVLSLGVAGFLVGTAGADDLICGIRTVARGYSFVSAPLPARGGAQRLFREPHEAVQSAVSQEGAQPLRAGVEALTPRETEVLTLMAEGLSNREIAERLGLSPKTIEAYRTRLSDKTGLRRRSELIRLAFTSGLLSKERG